MELLLLAAFLLLCLFLIPLGLPGTWLMVGAAVAYPILTNDNSFGAVTMVGTAVLAVVGEVIEFSLAGRYARKYGGGRRAEWGAILGGMVGAFVGVPVPIVGPVIGAFLGAFAGALVFEYSRGTGAGAATRVATGALLGRVLAAAAKVAIGVVIAVWIVVAAMQ
jgi:uncharacterized protein